MLLSPVLFPVLLEWSGLVSGKFILSTTRLPLLYSLLFSFIIPSFLPMVSWRINTGIGVCNAHTGRFRKALFAGNNPLSSWIWAHPWWPGWDWTCGFVVVYWCVFGCGWFVVTMFRRNGSLGSFSESIPPESDHLKLTSQLDSAMPASEGGSGEPRFVEWFWDLLKFNIVLSVNVCRQASCFEGCGGRFVMFLWSELYNPSLLILYVLWTALCGRRIVTCYSQQGEQNCHIKPWVDSSLVFCYRPYFFH